MAADRESAGKTSHRFATTRFANGFGDTGFSPLPSLRGRSTNVLPSSEALTLGRAGPPDTYWIELEKRMFDCQVQLAPLYKPCVNEPVKVR
jgi:hypothetical protein